MPDDLERHPRWLTHVRVALLFAFALAAFAALAINFRTF